MTYEEKLSEIFKAIGRKAVLEQAIEECGEFIHAAAKQLRILRGTNYTPVKLSENSNNLLEETADLELCLCLVATAFDCDRKKTDAQIERIKAEKLERWLDRLNIKGGNDEQHDKEILARHNAQNDAGIQRKQNELQAGSNGGLAEDDISAENSVMSRTADKKAN